MSDKNQKLFTPGTYTFFNEISQNNNKIWFHENKSKFEINVKQPLLALTDELEQEFGHAHIFRINRDIRFSNDKSPYKTNASFYISRGIVGLYLEVGINGVYVGGGMYEPSSDQLLRWRQLFDKDEAKEEVKKVISQLEDLGFELMTEHVLKSAPRGWKPDHKEIKFLRLQNLVMGKSLGKLTKYNFEEATNLIASAFSEIQKFNNLFDKYIGVEKKQLSRR
jgi:uncharacterized protein (TIGR02453 family)